MFHKLLSNSTSFRKVKQETFSIFSSFTLTVDICYLEVPTHIISLTFFQSPSLSPISPESLYDVIKYLAGIDIT